MMPLRFLYSSRPLVFAFLLAFSLPLGWNGCVAQDAEPATPPVPASQRNLVRVSKDLPFADRETGSIKADVYRPANDAECPMILMIHGGGWISGDKWNLADHARQLALQGYVVISINYRLAPKHPYPAALEDCREAIQWVRLRAKEWNGDIDRLGIWGYSAGAQLAAMLVVDPQPDAPKIRCCVLGGMPCDLTTIPEDSRLLHSVFGATRGENPEIYRRASPLLLCDATIPPCFLFHGEEDLLVHFSLSQSFQEKLLSLQVECELFPVKGQGHLVTFVHLAPREAAIHFYAKHLKSSSPSP